MRKRLLHALKTTGIVVTLGLMTETVFAWGGSGLSLGAVAQNITDSMNNIAKLLTAVSYVAGIGFALMGMMKFKAHKDQPQQVPLSQPLVLLAIAAGLVFLPSLISTTGQTVWDGSQMAANADGSGMGFGV